MSTSTTSAPSVLVLGWARVPSTIVLNGDGLIESSTLAIVAESDGMRYYLMNCCGASAKGSSNSPTGVCCRACYNEQPEYMGGMPAQAGAVTYALGDGVWHHVFVKDIDGHFGKAIAKP